MKNKIILFVGAAFLFAAISVTANNALVVSQQKKFIIAYPDKALPVEKTAADELAKYLKLTIGAAPIVVSESKLENPAGANAYIGKCKFTRKQDLPVEKFPQEGFQITVKNGRLFISGDDGRGKPFANNNRTGTLFGVYDFLEKEVGITWIWPGDSGEDIPELKQLRLEPFSRKDQPRLFYRGLKFSAAYSRLEPAEFNETMKYWFKRMKLSHVPKVWYGHSWGRYLDRTGMAEKHPEWLALWNGRRTGPHYCTSNQAFRDYMVEMCLKYPGNKGFSVVSISPNDGYGFCECEHCRALDPPGTDYASGKPNLSNRHWAYANYIAKEVKKRKPGLGVGMLAYSAYNQPPTNIAKFEDNLYTQLCYSTAYFVKPEKKAEFLANTLKWTSKGLNFCMYEYWGMHYWLDLPYIFTRQLKETMPILYRNGLRAIKSEAQKNWATQGPNYYLAAHLMWNPQADSDKILKRYYQAFGPAAEFIKGYYDTFEQALLKNQVKFKDFAYLELINSWPEVFPAEVVASAGEYIKKAQEAVKNKPVYQVRVHLVAVGYEYTKIMLELLAVYRKLGRAGVPLWCFGSKGAEAELKFWKKLPKMPEPWVKFWQAHPDKKISREEKIRLLKRALYLGSERERILNENAGNPAVSLGMYKYFAKRGYYQWHETIKIELKKESVK